MIQHIVLLKWKPDTTEEQILAAFRRAEHLPNEIDGVDSLTIGRNRVRHDHGFTHVLIVRLSDEQALEEYLDHPLRKRVRRGAPAAARGGADRDRRARRRRLRADPQRDWEYGASIGMGHLPDEP